MKTRAITGLFFVLVMLASILCGPVIFTFFYITLSLICLIEFFGLVKTTEIKQQSAISYIIALFLFIGISAKHFFAFENKWLLLVILPIISVFIAELYKKSAQPFSNIAYTFLGLIYTQAPFLFFFSIAFISGNYNPHLALGFFLLLWANDSGAYLFGVKLGKNRLFERHSPKKSWEGFFGGIFTSLIIGLILAYYFKDYALQHWLAMAIIISCFGTFGDLVESMFKRSINVKDSGKILPGHGGVLDRFDGLLLSAPIVFLYLYLINISNFA